MGCAGRVEIDPASLESAFSDAPGRDASSLEGVHSALAVALLDIGPFSLPTAAGSWIVNPTPHGEPNEDRSGEKHQDYPSCRRLGDTHSFVGHMAPSVARRQARCPAGRAIPGNPSRYPDFCSTSTMALKHYVTRSLQRAARDGQAGGLWRRPNPIGPRLSGR